MYPLIHNYLRCSINEVRGILITWIMIFESRHKAIDEGRNLVICHEQPLFDEIPLPHIYRWTSDPNEVPYEQKDHSNQKIRNTNCSRELKIIPLE